MLLHVCTQPRRPDGTGCGRGKRVGGVLRYLFGPGREEQHTNSRYAEGRADGHPTRMVDDGIWGEIWGSVVLDLANLLVLASMLMLLLSAGGWAAYLVL